MLPCLKAKGKKKRKDSRNRPWHVESGALELPKLSLQPARPRRSMVAFTKTSRAVRHSTSNEENCLVENLETYKLISHTHSKLAWLAHFLQSPELWFRFARHFRCIRLSTELQSQKKVLTEHKTWVWMSGMLQAAAPALQPNTFGNRPKRSPAVLTALLILQFPAVTPTQLESYVKLLKTWSWTQVTTA